jgi:hypothetical protein
MRTFAIVGMDLFHHELGENLWGLGFSGSIPVINVDFYKCCAYFYGKITAKKYAIIMLGTPEAVAALQNPKNDKFVVDLASEWEDTLFNMQKDRFGLWHAKSADTKDVDLLLGLSDKITYDLIVRANKFFKSGASDLTLAYEVTE